MHQFYATCETYNVQFPGNPQCCGAKIMDSDRRVAIETTGQLVPGNYSAVEVSIGLT